uniref:Uncharacterized protein n=1 Tax=Rhizophora mucronata TaxID=61149 RepID=A0A2P2PNY3_RHIMU
MRVLIVSEVATMQYT